MLKDSSARCYQSNKERLQEKLSEDIQRSHFREEKVKK